MNSRFAALLLLLFAFFASAGTDPFTNYVEWRYHPPSMRVQNIQGLPDRISNGKLHLHLRDFLELTLKNSTDIQLTRLDVFTSANSITANKAPFDPLLQLNFNTLRSVSPVSFFSFGNSGSGGVVTNPGQSGTGGNSGTGTGVGTGTGTGVGGSQVLLPQTISSLSQNSTAQFSELLPTGQNIVAQFSVNRSSGDYYSYPALFGSLNVTLTQHLLQNRTNLQAKGPLAIARTQLLITSERSQATIADSVALAARQYWAAIQLRDNIRVQEQSVELARKSYEHDKLALDLGALARLDIYQSETQVAERNRDLIAARYQYKASLDTLRRFIGADLSPALRETELVLEDDPAVLPPKESILPFEQALAKAEKARPETLAARQQTAVDSLNARISRDQLLPQLDLSLQGGGTGPGFNQLTGASGNPYPGLNSTLSSVLSFNYPSYGFGLSLNFPLRNSTARAGLANALVSRTRDQYTERQTRQQIIFDVHQALTNIELASASIEAATGARDLARKNVAAEQQKYQLGTITAFEVLDSQTRLASAESALLAANVTYQQAFIDYQRATWTLLDGLGIVVESPTTP